MIAKKRYLGSHFLATPGFMAHPMTVDLDLPRSFYLTGAVKLKTKDEARGYVPSGQEHRHCLIPQNR